MGEMTMAESILNRENESLRRENAALRELVQAGIDAIAPKDREGISLHEWNEKRLKPWLAKARTLLIGAKDGE